MLGKNAGYLTCVILYRAALSPGSGLDKGLTEKGILQLLFDLRFLYEVLSAGRPALVSAAHEEAKLAGNAEVTALRQSFGALESQLQVKTGPHEDIIRHTIAIC